jgi:plastocyanin
MRRTLLLLLAALALLGAGCGSDDSGSGSTGTTAGTTAGTTTSAGTGGSAAGKGTVTVDMANIQFDPKTVEVKSGQTVRWVNQDTVDHDVVSTSGDEFKSDQFGKGGTFEYKTKQPGTIDYECTLHPGMVGTLDVR